MGITGAFDNVRWSPFLEELGRLGASLRTELEHRSYSKKLERGCPQRSQLGPILWKVVMMPIYRIEHDAGSKTVTYADDILHLVGAARPETAFHRVETYLQQLIEWASSFGLESSSSKSQLMTMKGGLKPGYMVRMGTEPNATVIESTPKAKYLGVVLDPRKSYWMHVASVCGKSDSLYTRLRTMTSDN